MKKKILLTIALILLFLCLAAGAGVYLLTYGFYKTSNYVSDEDAMKNLNVEEEVDEISQEEAEGEIITSEQELEIEQMMKEFAEAEADYINSIVPSLCKQGGVDASGYSEVYEGTNMCYGPQAVAYARIRKIGNADYQRTERQRIVLTKILEKLKDLSLSELYDFVEAVLPLVTHNIPEDEMWSLLAKSPSILQYDLVKDRIPYDGMYKVIYVRKQDMLVPDWEKTIAKLKETLY